MNKTITIHNSRTIMYNELSRVMDFAIHDDNYLDSLSQNVINKNTKSGIDKTTSYLKRLYTFNTEYAPFKGLKYFWQNSEEKYKSKLALLFAIGHDYLLSESISIVINKSVGDKVSIESLEENVSQLHPGHYSAATSRSISQNIASSWKQAGFILGKMKNIRTQPELDYNIVAFALLLGYLDNLRGEFLLGSKYIRALGIQDSQVRELTFEAAKRDLLSYQYSGSVTAITFNNLFKKLEINGE